MIIVNHFTYTSSILKGNFLLTSKVCITYLHVKKYVVRDNFILKYSIHFFYFFASFFFSDFMEDVL